MDVIVQNYLNALPMKERYHLPTHTFCTCDPHTYSHTTMKKIFARTIDFSKVDTLIYHLPDGPTLSVNMNTFEELFDLEMEIGEVCDTSDIDGVVHFFPKGNA